jgi:hypothetical protein
MCAVSITLMGVGRVWRNEEWHVPFAEEYRGTSDCNLRRCNKTCSQAVTLTVNNNCGGTNS